MEIIPTIVVVVVCIKVSCPLCFSCYFKYAVTSSSSKLILSFVWKQHAIVAVIMDASTNS